MKRRTSQKLTINDLMTICTIVTCDQCGLDHAPVRACQEAALAALTEKEQS